MDKFKQLTLIRNKEVLARFLARDFYNTIGQSYIAVTPYDVKTPGIDDFIIGDYVMAADDVSRKYIITEVIDDTMFGYTRLTVITETQFLFEKELNYGILRKQLLAFWRNSGVPTAVFTAILTTILTTISLKLLDAFLRLF